jgi:hypothetical protein
LLRSTSQMVAPTITISARKPIVRPAPMPIANRLRPNINQLPKGWVDKKKERAYALCHVENVFITKFEICHP